MGRAPDASLVARLELRHLRSDLRFLLFAAGVDIDEDRGFLERTCQLYLAVIGVVAVALSWATLAALVLSAGFDDPRAAARGGASPTVFLAGATSLFAVGLAGLLGTVPALACALLADVLLAWLLRD